MCPYNMISYSILICTWNCMCIYIYRYVCIFHGVQGKLIKAPAPIYSKKNLDQHPRYHPRSSDDHCAVGSQVPCFEVHELFPALHAQQGPGGWVEDSMFLRWESKGICGKYIYIYRCVWLYMIYASFVWGELKQFQVSCFFLGYPLVMVI